ncbi:MAG: amino acid ABC transporter permease, partial [Lachnospiraceae bacterium]|nr:amino acid ABC transporter permease [Lachnospiraceae bacterium]
MEKFISGFNQSFIEGDRWLMYVKGIGVTLEVAAVALLLGIVLGVIVAIVRTLHDQQRPGQKHALLEVINKIAQLYTTVIRGTPLMVQLLIMYFVIFANTRNAVGVAM